MPILGKSCNHRTLQENGATWTHCLSSWHSPEMLTQHAFFEKILRSPKACAKGQKCQGQKRKQKREHVVYAYIRCPELQIENKVWISLSFPLHLGQFHSLLLGGSGLGWWQRPGTASLSWTAVSGQRGTPWGITQADNSIARINQRLATNEKQLIKNLLSIHSYM